MKLSKITILTSFLFAALTLTSSFSTAPSFASTSSLLSHKSSRVSTTSLLATSPSSSPPERLREKHPPLDQHPIDKYPSVLEREYSSRSAFVFSSKPTNSHSLLFSSSTKGEEKLHSSYRSAFAWPTVKNASVITRFSPPQHPWLTGHRGVDIASDTNSAIYAAGEGTIIYADKLVDRYVISIQHKNGLRTTYEPVHPIVAKGEHVQAGQMIGLLEAGHCSNQPCLHWGAKYDHDRYINPLSLVQPVIRLIE